LQDAGDYPVAIADSLTTLAREVDAKTR